jgi:hypothetical protein
VKCNTNPRTITLIYSSGAKVVGQCDEGYPLQFGYTGTGTSSFWAFLNENGFQISYDALCELDIPETILRKAKQLSPVSEDRLIKLRQEWERQQKKEEKRRQAEQVREEKRQQAQKKEDERRSKVQAMRRSSGKCVMCGQKLGFFLKLLGKDRHGKCTVFSE